jgi:hypothetical protein
MNITVCEYPNGYAGDFFCSVVSLCCEDYYKISELRWSPSVHLGIHYPINTKEDYINEFEYQYLSDKIYKDIDTLNEKNVILSSHGLENELQYSNWYNIDNRVNRIINLQLFPESKIINHSLFPIWNISQRDLKNTDVSKIHSYICQKMNERNNRFRKYDIDFLKIKSNHNITFANIIPALVDNDIDRFINVFVTLFEKVNLIKLKELFEEYQNIKMKHYFNFIRYLEENNIALPIYTTETYSYVIN